MKKLIVCGGLGSFASIRLAHLRDGLPPALSEEAGAFPSHSAVSTNAQRVAISPDVTKMVSTNGANNSAVAMNYYGTIGEDVSFSEAFTHSVSFGGTVTCCATSNTLRAYGGSSPNLYVFDWATGGLITVSVAGLGMVYAMAFSPSGKHLALVHSTTPFFRIYNTEDWTFVNAAQAFVSNGSDAAWSADGEKIVLTSSGSVAGAVSVYSKEGVQLFSSATSQAYSMISVEMLTGENAAIVSGSGTGATILHRIRKINLDTYSVTPLVEAPLATHAICLDEAQGIGYVTHGATDGRYVSSFSLGGGSLQALPSSINNLFINSSACLKLLKKNTGVVSGTVRDIANSPAKRTILAYERISGRLAGKTTSNAITGNYTLNLPNTREHDLVFQAAPGEQLNDLFFARVEPQAV